MVGYLKRLETTFRASENHVDAGFMKKYMRGQFEYYGIRSPKRREIIREFFKKEGLPDTKNLKTLTEDCWDNRFRDFQYFAMELLYRMRKKLPEDFIEVFQFMIVNKSWWDTVDYIAGRLVAFHFEKYPQQKVEFIRKWMDSGNIWLQRSCLLFQLHYKSKTDLVLTENLILRLQGSKEFFINKAIGWILREYSKTDPLWVTSFVENNSLAPLSKREAMKWMQRGKKK